MPTQIRTPSAFLEEQQYQCLEKGVFQCQTFKLGTLLSLVSLVASPGTVKARSQLEKRTPPLCTCFVSSTACVTHVNAYMYDVHFVLWLG